jgi:phenylalanyl-tRNA synthetase beta chain
LLDQRPISNAVDATNYVLWEMGKPTHVFDMDLLEGGKLIIRKAKNGEKLKTLDGVERTLTSEDLVVADAKKPVGLAGVMGGFDTMITDKTRNILIESAWWDPVTVRKMSRRHGLHTDASHRFERGADFESTVLSCDLVAETDSGIGRRRTGWRCGRCGVENRWIRRRWCCGFRRCGAFWAGIWIRERFSAS